MLSKTVVFNLSLALFALSCGFVCAHDFKAAMEEADAYLSNGQYLEATGAYQDISNRAADPEMKAKAMLRIGDIYSHFLNRYDKALEYYDLVKKQHAGSPHAANAYFNSGMIFYEKSRYAEAISQFKAYVDKYPGENRKDAAIFMMETCTRPPPPDNAKKISPKIPKDQVIRVLLMTGIRDVRVEAASRFEIRDATESRILGHARHAAIEAQNKTLKLNGAALGQEGFVISPSNGQVLSLSGIPYRGKVKVQKNARGGLDIINILPLEAYLYGVVPKEMPAHWFPEALKAQAVAARTYALYLMDKSRNRDYDVLPTTASQVYGGVAVEAEKATRAVDDTKGIVLLHNDLPVLAYFHANSGGMTEDVRQVWTVEIPYLKSVPDEYSLKAPGCTWKRTFNLDEIRRALNKNSLEVGAIEMISSEDRSPSGRIMKIRITHEGAETLLSGNDFRLKIDPTLIKSTSFNMTCNGREVSFEGKGYGHGVGMSQWGAYIMAREGHSYRDILQYYYQGVEIRVPQER